MQAELGRKIDLDNPASRNQHYITWKFSPASSKKSASEKAQSETAQIGKEQIKKSQSQNSREQQPSSKKRKKRPLTSTGTIMEKQQPAKKARVQERVEIPGLNVCFFL